MKVIKYKKGQMESNLIDTLSSLRRYKGLSQDTVASILGTTKSNISRFEHNKHSPSFTTLSNYIDAIGYDFEIFFINRDKG